MLAEALEIGWTQNVVILEADLSNEQRKWYLRAANQFGWSKVELIEKIVANAYEESDLSLSHKAEGTSVCNDEALQYKKNAQPKYRIWVDFRSPARILEYASYVKRRRLSQFSL